MRLTRLGWARVKRAYRYEINQRAWAEVIWADQRLLGYAIG